MCAFKCENSQLEQRRIYPSSCYVCMTLTAMGCEAQNLKFIHKFRGVYAASLPGWFLSVNQFYTLRVRRIWKCWCWCWCSSQHQTEYSSSLLNHIKFRAFDVRLVFLGITSNHAQCTQFSSWISFSLSYLNSIIHIADSIHNANFTCINNIFDDYIMPLTFSIFLWPETPTSESTER